MDYRYLGRSGFKISEITYGNWLTHGSQLENEQATSCVRAALEAGISTFDTADVYANTKAETVLGEALKGERRESLEIMTKVFGPIGPKGPNDVGLSRKHIMEAAHGSLRRLQTDYIDVYQAHRYDYETPLEETMQAFADLVRSGKVLYVGVSEWTADELRAGHALAQDLGFQLISNQPQYSMLWRVIEGEVVPASEELGISQVVWSPIAQGVLTGKYRPGEQPPEGSRATDEKGGANMIKRWMRDDVLERVQQLNAAERGDRPVDGGARGGLGAAEPERGDRHHRRVTAGAGARQREGGRRTAARRGAQQDRRDPRPGDRARSGPYVGELAEDPRGLSLD